MPVSTPNGYLDFTNATPRATKVIATSNVGVGFNDPLHALDVAGTANVGALTATSVGVPDLTLATLAANLVTYDSSTGIFQDSGGLFSNKLAVVSEQPPSALSGASTTVEKHGVYKVTASTGTPQNAFDKATGTSWVGSSSYTGGSGTGVYVGSTTLATGLKQGDWLAVEFPYKATLRHLTFTATDAPTGALPNKANLYATNDSLVWTELKNWESNENTIVVNATEAYKKFALVTTKTRDSNSTLEIGQLKLFCESFSVDGGKIEMATSAITGGETVVEQTTAHAREPAVLKKYPEVGMRDYTYNGYTVSSSSDQNITREAVGLSPLVARSAWCAFDDSEDSFWQLYFPTSPYNATSPFDANSNAPVTTDVNNTQHRGHWIKLKLPNAIKLQRMTKDHRNQLERWDSVVLLGSNDDTNWHVIKEFSLPLDSFTSTDINSDSAYTYILLIVKSLGNSDINVDVHEIGYYGYEERNTTGDLSLDTTITSKYNTPDLTNASLYLDGLKGSTATDYSGNELSVTATQVTYDSTEKAWTLSGAATSNIVSGDLGLEGDQPHSVSAWVKADVLNGDGLFHVGTAEGEGDAASRVGFVDDSHISWGGEDHFFSNAEWHNVTYTYNGEGSDKKLYLDGRLVGTAANEDTFGDYPPFAMSTYSQYGYTVSASSEYSGYYVWEAFDDTYYSGTGDPYFSTSAIRYNTTTGAFLSGNVVAPYLTTVSGTVYNGEWIQMDFPHKLVLDSVEFYPHSSWYGRIPYNGVVAGSNDGGVSWEAINVFSGFDVTATSWHSMILNSNKAYKSVRIVATALNSTGQNGYIGIDNTRFFGHRENDLVRFPDPTNVLKYPHVAMTGPAQRGYVATASSISNATLYAASNAFTEVLTGDDAWTVSGTPYNTSTGQYTAGTYSTTVGGTSYPGEYLQIETPRKIIPTLFRLASYSTGGRQPTAGVFAGSNDGSTWDLLKSYSGVTSWTQGTYNEITPDTNTSNSYKYFRLIVTYVNTSGDGACSIHGWQIYGTEPEDVVARVGDGYDGKVRNLRVFSTALSDDRVQEIFDADKDEFGLAKSSVSVYRGHLGIGTTEPKAALTVMDEVGELEEFPPRAMTEYETYMEGHGVFRASASSFVDTSVLSGVWTQNIYPWYAFNKTSTYGWVSTSSVYTNGLADSDSDNRFGILGEWLEIEMPSKIKLKHFTLSLGYDEVNPSGTNTSRFPKVFNLYKSNDGVMWTTAMEITTPTAPAEGAYGTTYTYNINESEYYSRYLIQVKQTHSNTSGYTNPSSHAAIGEWRLFGTREQGASTLHNGELTLTRNLTVPRIGPPLDADDTPRRDRLVVEYNTSTNNTENGVVKDTSGRGLDGLTYNGASYDATEKALVFDGTGDYIFTGNLNNPAGAWAHSYSFWVNFDGTGAEMMVHFGKAVTGKSSALRLNTTTEILWFFYGNDTKYSCSVTAGSWYHISAIYDGNISRDVYIDGVRLTETQSSTTAANYDANSPLHIGTRVSKTQYLDGSISNFKLYDVALTADEVKRLYDMGRCDEGHHVVNFSKTRVGIGLGDGEAPRGALDVRGETPFIGPGLVIHQAASGNWGTQGDPANMNGLLLTLEGETGLTTGSSYWNIATQATGDSSLLFAHRGKPTAYIQHGNSNNPLDFTGQHRTFIKDVPFSQAGDLEGLIVSSDQNKYIKISGGIETGSNAIMINESLPVVSLSTTTNDKKCFGVISASEDPEQRSDVYGSFVTPYDKEKGDTRVYINSVGEGAIWVTDINGSLESGDYITTSNIAGYGQKQDSDSLKNYTVAKITMDCDFEPVTQPIQCIKRSNVVETHYTGLVPVVKSVPHEFVTTVVSADDAWSNVSISPSDVTYAEWSNLEANVQNTYTLEYTSTSNVVYDVKYTKTTVSNVTESDPWDVVHIEPPTVTYAEYSNLEANVQNTYSLTYTMTTKVEATEAVYSNLSTEDKEFFVPTYYHTVEQTVDADYPGAVKHETVTDRLENDLDEYGQLQWEDDPSGATEKAYKIRYLDASGQQTDEANAVHMAAFVGCTYHCG